MSRFKTPHNCRACLAQALEASGCWAGSTLCAFGLAWSNSSLTFLTSIAAFIPSASAISKICSNLDLSGHVQAG